ncbi:DDB1- and CUL4-associated factor 17 [Osmerus mordax]|uniref:DDB1- and CUL4-associated factor 17 n=1 Tax=Osmerus mordax TaxID=8014 RepID=UPI00350F3FDC
MSTATSCQQPSKPADSRVVQDHPSCAKRHLVLPQRKRQINAIDLLSRRSRGIPDSGTLSRHNLNILRGIVLQDSRNFIKVWTKSSKSTIRYESGRIYFENYQRCYSCLPSEPQLLYELPKRAKAEKIQDALLCQSPLDKVLPTRSDHKPSLLALTANNWLYRLSAETGEQLQKIFLSSHHKFRYISWDVDQETFYVKSTLKKAPFTQQAGLNQNTLVHIAVFHVSPLQLVGSLEINKNVFGNTVIDVSLSQGVLAVSHSTKIVKLYSFEHILKKFMTKTWELGDPCHLKSTNIVGEAPCGIPVNIDIKESPPVLFEVPCFDNGIQIGGHPWHYIYTSRQGAHHICSLKDKALVHFHGIQDMKSCSLESDWIYFHPDDSGRIIHVGPSTINMLKIQGGLETDMSSRVVQDFSITAHRDNRAAAQVTVTSSGRTVKRRFHQLDDDPEQETFRIVEFEDELDLLVVVEVTSSADEGKAQVRLHDNQSGMLLKRIPLMESWDETYRHELFFDKDTIVHIGQTKTNFCCSVYKIRHGMEELD